jgi:purine-binding chemotaxis protein CheW
MNKMEEIDKATLEERAKELARETVLVDEGMELGVFLEFSMMGSRCAVHLDKVDAVIRIGDIISVPMTARHFSGIIRRQGHSLALVSLRHFFNSSAQGIADADFAMIVTAGGKQFALQIEEIVGVIQLALEKLKPPPDNFDAIQLPFVAGVTTDGLTVYDLERLVESSGFGTEKTELLA